MVDYCFTRARSVGICTPKRRAVEMHHFLFYLLIRTKTITFCPSHIFIENAESKDSLSDGKLTECRGNSVARHSRLKELQQLHVLDFTL